MVYLDCVIIGTTGMCNSNCLMCPGQLTGKGLMDNELFEKIIIQLKPYKIGQIGLGLFNEPLTDKYIVDKAKIIKKHIPSMNIVLSTNAQLLNQELTDQLAPLIGVFLISYHGLDKEVYEKMMFPLKQDITNKNVEYLLSLKSKNHFDVNMPTVMTKLTLDQAEKMHEYWTPKGVYTEQYRLTNRCGHLKNYDELTLNPEMGCCPVSSKGTLLIDWNGDVIYCCQDFLKEIVLANLNTDSVAYALNNPIRESMDNKMRNKQWSEVSTCKKCKWDNLTNIHMGKVG